MSPTWVFTVGYKPMRPEKTQHILLGSQVLRMLTSAAVACLLFAGVTGNNNNNNNNNNNYNNNNYNYNYN